MDIPQDILLKIDELFPKHEDNIATENLIEEIWQTTINVGHPQLVRSILPLSEGDLVIIRKIVDSDFDGDPRDLIMRAEQKLGNPGHFFIPAFDEINQHKK
jgi:hypothetical protein